MAAIPSSGVANDLYLSSFPWTSPPHASEVLEIFPGLLLRIPRGPSITTCSPGAKPMALDTRVVCLNEDMMSGAIRLSKYSGECCAIPRTEASFKSLVNARLKESLVAWSMREKIPLGSSIAASPC